jgi:biopolymer transport protein ExbD
MIKQVQTESAISPNLVPMVDIMFLLLLFLMVGADMGQRELEDVHLPIASSVKEDPQAAEPRLTLNVYHSCEEPCAAFATRPYLCGDRSHWAIGIKGQDFHDEAPLTAFLAGEVATDLERRGEPAWSGHGPRPDCRLHVMIRADQAALYEQVQRAMTSCALSGIDKVEIGAAADPTGG